MKIVFINTVYGIGSTGRITQDIAQHVMEEGHTPFVVYGRGKKNKDPNFYKMGGIFDFSIHVLRNFFKDESAFGSTSQTKKLVKWLEQIQPDIIHLHNLHGFYLNIEILFAYLKKTSCNVIWTLHDCWPYTGHCAYYDYISCNKWKTQCHKCAQHRKAYPYALFKDGSQHNYERKKEIFLGVKNLTIVTPSKWLKEQVEQSFLKDYPVEIIYNGIDLSVFAPTNEEKEKLFQKKTVLGVANVWEQRKGLAFFKALQQRLPDEIQIVLVGVPKIQQYKINKKRSNHKQTNHNAIKFIPKTKSREQLACLYRNAEVFVNPTLEDNFPTTNLEALACGTPVITFQTGGSSESINQLTGIVVPRGNMKQLEQAILKICNDRGNRFSKELCRNRATRFDKHNTNKEYVSLYEKK